MEVPDKESDSLFLSQENQIIPEIEEAV
jgi:hypothetical protein